MIFIYNSDSGQVANLDDLKLVCKPVKILVLNYKKEPLGALLKFVAKLFECIHGFLFPLFIFENHDAWNMKVFHQSDSFKV